MNKITKKDIIAKVADTTGETKKTTEAIVNAVLAEITSTVVAGDTVDLAGFGKFEVSERAARTGINPATKEKIEIAASKAVKFKAAKALKEAVNK